jgi:hypothetical protein
MMAPSKMNKASAPCLSASINQILGKLNCVGARLRLFNI